MGLPVFGQAEAIEELGRKSALDVAGTAFVIEEVTAKRRKVTLTGRCLPFRPVGVSTAQRFNKTYYPGATEATIQVFGPDHTDMTVSGRFLTRYMADHDYFTLDDGSGTDVRVETADYARCILNEFCRGGQEVRVSWGRGAFGTVQRGIVRSAKFNEQRPEVIEWELQFEWLADTDQTPQLKAERYVAPTKGLLDRINDALDKAQTVLNEAEGAYKEYVVQNIAKLNAMVARVNGLAQQVVNLAGKPAEAARSVLVVCQQVKQDVWDMQAAGLALVGKYKAVADEFTRTGQSIDFLPVTPTLPRTDDSVATASRVAALDAEFNASILRLLIEADKQRRAAQVKVVPKMKAIHFVATGDTLRKVSTRYYSKPDRWTDIADANELSGDDLVVGMVLLIPEG